MMKTKLIYKRYITDEDGSFDEKINKFIKDKQVVDIKFCADDGLLALIMYKEING